MKVSELFVTTALTLSTAWGAQAQDVPVVIDDQGIANQIADYIVSECQEAQTNPSPQATSKCVGAGVTGAYTIAEDITHYFDLLATHPDELAKTKTGAFRLGVLNGEFHRKCQYPLKDLSGFSGSLETQIDESVKRVGTCFDYIENQVTETLGQRLLPTPRNVVAQHLNSILSLK